MGMSIGDSCPDDATLDRLHAGELEAATGRSSNKLRGDGMRESQAD